MIDYQKRCFPSRKEDTKKIHGTREGSNGKNLPALKKPEKMERIFPPSPTPGLGCRRGGKVEGWAISGWQKEERGLKKGGRDGPVIRVRKKTLMSKPNK